ncbi:MAG: hypothetical protein OEX19_15730 [Gammaproteobacteria bacterium]|nr:hypothetical protein [Gammaproteobacteria bacterium]
MDINQNNIKDLDGFIEMLRAACEDRNMNKTLSHLLSLPNDKRKVVIIHLVNDLESKGAPCNLVRAIACLTDDLIAEKAYKAIYQCTR